MHISHLRTRGVLLMLVCLLGLSVAIGATDRTVRNGRVGGPITSSKVLGVVWNVDGTAVPDARLRLRNLSTGRIEATAVANQAGQFTFENIETGSYLIEYVDASGKVRAIGQSFRIDSGETIATFVRLVAPQRWITGFFSNAATAAISAASSAGMTAVGSNAPPASPE